MILLGLGIVLLVLKYFEVAPVAAWSWWLALLPFALTVAWWAWADASGYTRRKAIEREERRRSDRIERQREAMGQGRQDSH
jgi:small Trp-rich protein